MTRGVHVCHIDVTSGESVTIAGTPTDPRTLALLHASGRTLSLVDEDTPQARALIDEATRTATAPTRPWEGAETNPARSSVAVVICTMGSQPLLRRAVEAVLAQSLTDFELIVVDNAPKSGHTQAALLGIDDPRLRIVAQPRPGLSYARNRGVLATQADLIAFTDDDAIADPCWLERLLEPLRADHSCKVVGATGIVLPAELTHPAQRWFEARGGFPKDSNVCLWSIAPIPHELQGWGITADGGPFYPYTTARVGAGVSMAFVRAALISAGPFDPALGAGTPTRGGEDLDMFRRIMLNGGVIIHTPDAWTFHRHRPDLPALEGQIRGNGSGMSSLLTKAIISNPLSVLRLATRIPAVLRRLQPGSERVAGKDEDVPSHLTKLEIKGFLEGPLLYLKARVRLANERRRRRSDKQP